MLLYNVNLFCFNVRWMIILDLGVKIFKNKNFKLYDVYIK